MACWQTETPALENSDLQRWALWLKERRLEIPAVLALESLKPLHNIVYQMLVFSSPMIEILGVDPLRAVQLWEDPGKLESLLSQLDAM
jgi:hypothetical protein